MSTKGGPGGDKLGIGEIFWYRNDVGEEDRAIEVLTDRGELFFYRLRRHYLYRAGTLPYDPSAICTKMGYKTVRPFNAGFDELVGAGLVSVEDGMIRFPHADRIVADVQANRDKKANDGRIGGETKATNARNNQETSEKLPPNLDEVLPKHETESEQNQGVDSSSSTINHKPIEEAPLPPQAVPVSPVNSHTNSVVESDHLQAIVQAFDRLIVEVWGKQAARFGTKDTDIKTAAMWLDRMDGDVSGLIQAIDECMVDEADRGRKPPNSLSFYNSVIPRFMATVSRPCTLTTATVGKSFSAGPTKAAMTGKQPLWLEVHNTALDNGWFDIAKELRGMADVSVDDANRYAESVRDTISAKKERAAA